ncbi:hypothetical protein EPO04_00285 [Patescibacteria group bacterium]|nr:MAG: hypothetical protein EPO04_00285 [Patescibacteria group bacterium]
MGNLTLEFAVHFIASTITVSAAAFVALYSHFAGYTITQNRREKRYRSSDLRLILGRNIVWLMGMAWYVCLSYRDSLGWDEMDQPPFFAVVMATAGSIAFYFFLRKRRQLRKELASAEIKLSS